MKNNTNLGILFSLIAASINASIGIVSLNLINSGLSPEETAFYKTFIAFVFTFIILSRFSQKHQIKNISPDKPKHIVLIQIAFCSLLGIFTLFFFETVAYNFGSPPNVVVTLMASAAISALVFGFLLLKEKISTNSVLGTLLAVVGIAIISWKGEINTYLLVNASIAGIGYGCFSVFIKKFQLNGGLFLTKYLLLFGSIYLFISAIPQIGTIVINKKVIFGMLFLAIFPTIIGFYCTTMALKYLSPSKVQVTELSEPIFSVLLTLIFLHTVPNYSFFVGAALIIMGIILINNIFIKSKSLDTTIK